MVKIVAREHKVKISRAGFYNWVTAYKAAVVKRSDRGDLTPAELERTAKADLIAEIEALRTENRKLRDRLVAEMMRHWIRLI